MRNSAGSGNAPLVHAGHIARGTLWGFLGTSLSLPTGLLTAAFLTRRLGPQDYGILTVAAAVILWVEVVTNTGFNRAAVKFISESADWKPAATKFLQAQTAAGMLAAVLVWLLAPALARIFNTPDMTHYIRLYSLNVPVMSAASAHFAALVGRGHYGRRAVLNAVFWMLRLGFILWYVGIRPTVTSAVLAQVTTSAVVLVWARVYIRPPVFFRSDFPMQHIWDYGWVLFLFTIGLHTFGHIDLFFVKAMSAAPEAAGYYSAAKNFTLVPAIFTASFTPLLVGKLSLLARTDQLRTAGGLCRGSLHAVIGLLPVAAMAAGCAGEIVALVYGDAFLPAAALLAVLVFFALGVSMIGVTTSMLIAAGRPERSLLAIFPAAGLSAPGLLVVLSRYGALEATLLMCLLSWTGAACGCALAMKTWNIRISTRILASALMISPATFCMARIWQTGPLLLFVKLAALILATLFLYGVTGVLRPKDLAFIRIVLGGKTPVDG